MELSALAIFLIAIAVVIGFIFGVMVAAVAAGPNARLEEVPLHDSFVALLVTGLSDTQAVSVVREFHERGYLFARDRINKDKKK